MARKRWSAQTEITDELVQSREKRKWQTTFRRYVIEKSPCPAYAPYFGLDIENIRKWFECQFEAETTWENFGKQWQFEHVIPLACFNHQNEQELRLCWHFLNIRIASLEHQTTPGQQSDILAARKYFEELYIKTGLSMAKSLCEKINQLETAQYTSTETRQKFLLEIKDYLQHIEPFTSFEFELLNQGKTIEDIRHELTLLNKNLGQ